MSTKDWVTQVVNIVHPFLSQTSQIHASTIILGYIQCSPWAETIEQVVPNALF